MEKAGNSLMQESANYSPRPKPSHIACNLRVDFFLHFQMATSKCYICIYIVASVVSLSPQKLKIFIFCPCKKTFPDFCPKLVSSI